MLGSKFPILCGGTGFYIKAVLMDFQLPTVGPDKKLRQELESYTLENLIQVLENSLPGASKNILVDTKRRVIRAIAVSTKHGIKCTHGVQADTATANVGVDVLPYNLLIGSHFEKTTGCTFANQCVAVG